MFAICTTCSEAQKLCMFPVQCTDASRLILKLQQ